MDVELLERESVGFGSCWGAEMCLLSQARAARGSLGMMDFELFHAVCGGFTMRRELPALAGRHALAFCASGWKIPF